MLAGISVTSLGFSDQIQPLLDEITILREQNLQLNQQLLDERINAAENP